jgi:hypothetical protein
MRAEVGSEGPVGCASATTELPARFEHPYRHVALGALDARYEAGKTASDYGDLHHVASSSNVPPGSIT